MQNPFQNSGAPGGGGDNGWYNNSGSAPSGGMGQMGQFESTFPTHPMQQQYSQGGGDEGDIDLENEPPILEELGINMEDVLARIKVGEGMFFLKVYFVKKMYGTVM